MIINSLQNVSKLSKYIIFTYKHMYFILLVKIVKSKNGIVLNQYLVCKIIYQV